LDKIPKKDRIQEIDIAKGLACLLMIAAHLPSVKMMPFGTFAAPLFFACSGMNTILLIEKTKGNRCYDLLHLVFPLLLFFGGSTQVVIFHGGRLRVIPAFLQCIALSLLLIFALSKLFKDPRRCGMLFPVPFLVKGLQSWLVPGSFKGLRLEFIIGGNFSIFPWLGFFLFGIFLLWLKRRSLPWLVAALASAFILSFAAAGVPLKKFHMSLSYILLAFVAIALAFFLAYGIARGADRSIFRSMAELFALPGRNALMFLYLHYFVMRFFTSVNFFPSLHLYLVLETLYLFSVCWALLLIYERVKYDTRLLLPTLSLFLALGALRWGGLLKAQGGRLPVADLFLGILFAFVYVQLRRKFAARCERGKPASA
jgi:hypothetical protein